MWNEKQFFKIKERLPKGNSYMSSDSAKTKSNATADSITEL